jgi:MerR family transcriptional regulator/heat shock protein HspR
MTARKYAIILTKRVTRAASGIGAGEVAAQCGVHPELIDRFVDLGLVEPLCWHERRNEWLFDKNTIPLVRKIIRLRNQLGINYAGIGVVLELLSRIERLESRILELESSSGLHSGP